MTESTLQHRLETVRAGVRDAAAQAGRDPSEIVTVVVTKFHPLSLIRELIELGVRDIGESRHQEAVAKAAELKGEPLTMHFVGQVQSKKARAVSQYANVVHSIDRASVVDAFNSVNALPIEAFVQVNLTDDPQRGGVQPRDLDELVDQVLASDNLTLRGLMAVAPLEGEPRRAFAQLRELSESIAHAAPTATQLSMGMSQDYREAIAEGATHLRIGSAITGIRPLSG